FNMSDIAGAEGKLRGLKLEPTSGSGMLAIDRITFEREAPILPNAGRITEAKANHQTLSVSGTTERQWLDSGAVSIELRHAPLYKSELPADSLELLGYCPYAQEFIINTDNTRLDGKMTHLSSRLAVYARLADGRLIPVGQPFFIENWRDFTTNRYQFDLPGQTYNVIDFGATGNGFTNDNHAIQKAIDTASEAGGGRVLIPGGGEYIVTDLNMRSNVELHIEPGAVLRQSSLRSDYTSYRPEYGHDNIIPGVPWTHCMYTNMPLILAKDIENIKITGGGTIRMEDTYTINDAWEHYARLCSDRIHIVPIAVCNTHNVEISDIDILRSNNYHTIFYRADSVFIGNLKMLEVACLSGDGISLGNAVTNVQIDRCVFESNDDGIVIAASYKDPRGGGWRIRVDSIDATIRNIDVMRSYIDSNRGGGGKAIAFIPWASTNPRLDHNEIDGINVHDCVLRGGHSVGTWPDNPFDGKPFTNDEQDDYSPIKNVDITGNEYLSLCDMLWVVPTSFVTDCGLHGSSEIKNGNFTDRTAYWTPCGNIDSAIAGEIKMQQGDTMSQGLWLTPGTYEVKYTASQPMTVIPGETFTVDTDGNFTITLKANSATTLSDVNLIKH
ncbi:MAG: hypothetical protein K2M98_04990, partial [Muribaculum sp.]|nr:hypothetical protein [Muribaculum sp.]